MQGTRLSEIRPVGFERARGYEEREVDYRPLTPVPNDSVIVPAPYESDAGPDVFAYVDDYMLLTLDSDGRPLKCVASFEDFEHRLYRPQDEREVEWRPEPCR